MPSDLQNAFDEWLTDIIEQLDNDEKTDSKFSHEGEGSKADDESMVSNTNTHANLFTNDNIQSKKQLSTCDASSLMCDDI